MIYGMCSGILFFISFLTNSGEFYVGLWPFFTRGDIKKKKIYKGTSIILMHIFQLHSLGFRRPQTSPLHTLTIALGVLLQTPGLIARDYDLQKIWVAIRHVDEVSAGVKPMLSLFRC